MEVSDGDDENDEVMEESEMFEMASDREEFFSLSPKTEKLTASSLEFKTKR